MKRIDEKWRYLRLPSKELPYKESRDTEGRNKKGQRGRQRTDRDEIKRSWKGELREDDGEGGGRTGEEERWKERSLCGS